MIHSVGHSERTGVVVEPRLSTQWFVKMAPLAKKAIDKKTRIKSGILPYQDSIKRFYVGWKMSMIG